MENISCPWGGKIDGWEQRLEVNLLLYILLYILNFELCKIKIKNNKLAGFGMSFCLKVVCLRYIKLSLQEQDWGMEAPATGYYGSLSEGQPNLA